MRRATVAMLTLGYSLHAFAADEPCVDVVGITPGPSETVLNRAVERGDSALAAMKRRNQTLADTIHPLEDAPAEKAKRKGKPPPTSEWGSFAKTVEAIHQDNLANLQDVERQRMLATVLTPVASCQSQLAQKNLQAALDRTLYTAALTSQLSAQYGLYIGPNFSLGGSGNWRPGGETLVRFDTEVFTVHDRGYDWLKHIVPDSGWMRGYSEISYQTINALQEVDDASSVTAPPDNIFSSAGGYLRLNGGLQIHFTDWIGIQAGGGLSSLPNANEVTRLEPRAFGGLHLQTLYNDGALAQLFIGAAWDKFWQNELYNDPSDPTAGTHTETHYGRYNVDGLLFLPVQANNVHLATRLFADAPLDGRGPSDVRVSILLYYDFNNWLNTFLPIKSAKDTADILQIPGL